MLRSLALNAARSRRRPALVSARLYSPWTPTPSQLPHDVPPPVPAPRKPKVDLRPAPVRPKTLAAPAPNAPVNKQASSQAPPLMSLSAAKEAAIRDFADAERHGYLTPAPPDANWFRATLHKAIQLAKFYFRGVKLIFSRRKEIAAIRTRIKAGGPPLSRAEFRLIHTQKDDVNKVIPFLIIALLLEEVIPLIAIYAPFMLPSTCILPSQRERIDTKRAEKALASSINSGPILSSLKAHSSSGRLSLASLKQVEGAPTALCSILGLSTLGLDALRIRRVRLHLQFLADDDALLLQGETNLSEYEQSIALAERGLLIKTTSGEKTLQSWLNVVRSSEDAISTRLYLIVSNQ